MSKVRVYEVAKDVGLPNRELVQKIAAMGIPVRNHMSALDPTEVDRVKRALDKERQKNVVEERIRPTVLRRRVKSKQPPPEVVEAATAPVSRDDDIDGPAVPVIAESPPETEAAPATATTGEVAEVREEMEPQAPPTVSAEPEERAALPAAEAEAPAPTEAEPVAVEAPSPPAARREVEAGPAVASPPAEETEAAPAAGRGAALPPGVVQRGNAVAPGAGPLSEQARQRILSEHAARQPNRPRRKEIGPAALGPSGRSGGRPGGPRGRRKMAPGKKGKQTEITVPSAQKRVIRIEDQVQLQTLAQRMSLKATDVLMKLMQLGMANVHINSTLDTDTAKILASEFGYEVENVARSAEEIVDSARGEFTDKEEDRELRSPIVTVMGHVDHGKTSLLDRIRKADVAAGEAGGITQHIGAYRVDTAQGPVVFLDTPGHEAFTAMRARGANATDIVILVVAADDGVMPQTKEAINHARAAEVPIVVAVNKIDKDDAKPDVVRNELAAEGLQPEEWGGETIFVHCSAQTGEGVTKLLESVVLTSELLDLKANSAIPAEGVVLESYLDRGRGPVANVLVRNGTLDTGDYVVAGAAFGRVRAMTDDRGKQLKNAPPATPIEVLGLNAIPAAGDKFYVVTDQKKAEEVAQAQRGPSQQQRGPAVPMSLDQIADMLKSGDAHELKLVIKADVQGSTEALEKALTDLSTDKVNVNVIHTGVGGITENDVMLASASNAIVLGFNVRPAGQAASLAKKESVDLRKYNVIYEAVDDVKKAMTGLLAPKIVEKELGQAEIRDTFTIPKIGTIAGCYVTDGKIARGAKARLVRDSVQIWEGKIASLRRFKDDVREVASGYECGLGLDGYNDVKPGDVVEIYDHEEVAATLE